jgi:hypothetical protein
MPSALDVLAVLVLGLSLLENVVLDTALLGLAFGTQLLEVGLTLLVASQSADSAANCSVGSVRDTGAEVAKLALGLLLLTLKVLLSSRGLQRLELRVSRECKELRMGRRWCLPHCQ